MKPSLTDKAIERVADCFFKGYIDHEQSTEKLKKLFRRKQNMKPFGVAFEIEVRKKR